MMTNILFKRLSQSFSLTRDLLESLTDQNLGVRLPNIRSNKIGEQFWCIVGARESYLAAVENGGWSGFSCSLQSVDSQEEIKICLLHTEERVQKLNVETLNETQIEFLFALLEHEVQHHGQLIRYVYGNGLSFPKTWNERYTV